MTIHHSTWGGLQAEGWAVFAGPLVIFILTEVFKCKWLALETEGIFKKKKFFFFISKLNI